MGRFTLECDRRVLARGVLLVLVGLICPLLVTEELFGIYRELQRALAGEELGLLLSAALRLVLLNSVRATPIYLGAFMLSDALTARWRGRRIFVLNIVLTAGVVALVYQLVDPLFHVQYDFGVTAMMLILFILFLSYIHLFAGQFLNQLLLLDTLLISAQCLDVVPLLSPYSFGRGEISRDIKMAARVFQVEDVLNIFSLTLCGVFLFCAVIQVMLLYKEYRLRLSTERSARMELELHRTQMEALRLRSLSEVQFLVHDLKSPLTTVQGLVSLSSMMEQDPLLREYLGKITDATTAMSEMISEILYEDKKSPVSTEDLMRIVLAQASIHIAQEKIHYANRCPQVQIRCNALRLARAVNNVLENADHAIDPERGRIDLTVDQPRPDRVRIRVRDNGVGMDPGELEQLWQPGFSRNDSTGLGMSFIRQVVEQHRGTVEVESEKGRATTVTIELEEYRDGHTEEDDPGH